MISALILLTFAVILMAIAWRLKAKECDYWRQIAQGHEKVGRIYHDAYIQEKDRRGNDNRDG